MSSQSKAPLQALNLFSLKGKTAVVTGGSRGIGWAIVEAYASAGADIVFYYNRELPVIKDKINFIKKTYNVRCEAYRVQLTDTKSIQSATDSILNEFGKIDIFVANAGVSWTDGAVLNIENDDESYSKWRKLFDLNVDAVHLCARSIGKVFKEQGFGNFIITASMSGHVVNVPQLQAPYNASKAAIAMYGKSLAVEWVKFARVNMVSPGYVATDLVDEMPKDLMETWKTLTPKARLAKPEELVGAYLYLASDASSFCYGTDIVVDGGYTVI